MLATALALTAFTSIVSEAENEMIALSFFSLFILLGRAIEHVLRYPNGLRNDFFAVGWDSLFHSGEKNKKSSRLF